MLQRAGHLFPLGHVCPCCLSNYRRFSKPYEALCLHLSPMQSSCDTVRKPTRAPAPLGTPVRTVAGGQHCTRCPHNPVHTLTGPAASRSRQLMLRASAPDPPCGRCDPPRVSQSPARGLPSPGHVGQSGCLCSDLAQRGAAPLPPWWTGLWAGDPFHPVGSFSLQGSAVVPVF